MNNEPVAWIEPDVIPLTHIIKAVVRREQDEQYSIPLYTHPIKELKCIVKDCANHKHEGSFNGDVCSPCYQFIAHGKGVYSQAYRNAKPAELTDEEIIAVGNAVVNHIDSNEGWIEFARAILRKAQENG